MKNLLVSLLLIFPFSFNWADSPPVIKYQVHYKSGQKTKVLKVGAKPVYLELGEKVKGIEIKGEGEYRLSQRTESSVTVMDEGPHLDLTEWKHGLSSWKKLMRKENLFLYEEQFEEKDFPEVTNEELVKAARDEGGERWAEMAKKCKTPGSYPCGIAPSRYLFKVEKLIDGKWKRVGDINLHPPMGC